MLFELGLGRSQRDVVLSDLLDRKQGYPQLLSSGLDAEGRRVDFHHRIPDLMDRAQLVMVGAEDVTALQVAQVIFSQPFGLPVYPLHGTLLISRLAVAEALTEEGLHRLCHVGVLTLLERASCRDSGSGKVACRDRGDPSLLLQPRSRREYFG